MRVSDFEGSDGSRPTKKKEEGKWKREGERGREEMAEQKGDGKKSDGWRK